MRGARLALLLVWPWAASAHGPAPAALEAVGPFDGRPTLVRTNIGLALREGDAYRYLCPGVWGAEDRFPDVVRFAGGELAMFHDGVLVRSDPSACAFTHTRLQDATTGVGLARQDDVAWLVTRGEEGSRIWRFGPSGEATIVAAEPTLALDSAVVHQGALWVAGARPPVLLRIEGDTVEQRPLELDDPQFVTLRATASALYASVAVLEGVELHASVDGVAWQRVGVAELSVHGPAEHEGVARALFDGVLQRQAEPLAAFTADEAVSWTCLHRAEGGAAVACADRGLVRLEGDPPRTTAVFALEDIAGPGDCLVDPALQETCEQQWLHFAAEAGLYRFDAGILPDAGATDAGALVDGATDAASVDTDEGDGCRAAPGGGEERPPPLLLLLLGLARARPVDKPRAV